MSHHFWKSKILIAFVIGLFSLMMFAETMPLTAQGKAGNENGEPNQAAEKNQSVPASAVNNEEATAPPAQLKTEEAHSQPTVKEKVAAAPKEKKKKKFPWLLAIAATLLVGAAVYFIIAANKKYTLTTTVGTGVSGEPAAGSAKHKKGSVVNYNYSATNGYTDLVVTLDGAVVAASGTVKMDKNHTLSATAVQSFILTVTKNVGVNGTPETGTYTYASGAVVSYSYTLASNYINLVVKLDNVAVAASGTFVMNANHALTASATYDDPNVTYTLVVEFWNGNGAGTPAAGTYTYPKGTIVNYDYYGTTSYPYISVYIDMVDTCFKKLPNHCTGTIVMNQNRSVGVQAGL